MFLAFLKIHVLLKHSLTLGVLQRGQHLPWLRPCLHRQPEFSNQIITEMEYALVEKQDTTPDYAFSTSIL